MNRREFGTAVAGVAGAAMLGKTVKADVGSMTSEQMASYLVSLSNNENDLDATIRFMGFEDSTASLFLTHWQMSAKGGILTEQGKSEYHRLHERRQGEEIKYGGYSFRSSDHGFIAKVDLNHPSCVSIAVYERSSRKNIELFIRRENNNWYARGCG